MPSPRFTFAKRHLPHLKLDQPWYRPLATFPSFKLAWDNANNMFTECGYEVIGCAYDPGTGSEPPEADFTVVKDRTIEEYRIAIEGV